MASRRAWRNNFWICCHHHIWLICMYASSLHFDKEVKTLLWGFCLFVFGGGRVDGKSCCFSCGIQFSLNLRHTKITLIKENSLSGWISFMSLVLACTFLGSYLNIPAGTIPPRLILVGSVKVLYVQGINRSFAWNRDDILLKECPLWEKWKPNILDYKILMITWRTIVHHSSVHHYMLYSDLPNISHN